MVAALRAVVSILLLILIISSLILESIVLLSRLVVQLQYGLGLINMMLAF